MNATSLSLASNPYTLKIVAKDFLTSVECNVCLEGDDTPDILRPTAKARAAHPPKCRGNFYEGKMTDHRFNRLVEEDFIYCLEDCVIVRPTFGRLCKIGDHQTYEVWVGWTGTDKDFSEWAAIIQLQPKLRTIYSRDGNGDPVPVGERLAKPTRHFQRGLRRLLRLVEHEYSPALPGIYLVGPTEPKLLPVLGEVGTEAWFKAYLKANFNP